MVLLSNWLIIAIGFILTLAESSKYQNEFWYANQIRTRNGFLFKPVLLKKIIVIEQIGNFSQICPIVFYS